MKSPPKAKPKHDGHDQERIERAEAKRIRKAQLRKEARHG